jgi:DUF1680 family protein
MFQLHGEAKYLDVLEKILYNGLISGIGLDGKSFFYTNAMQIHDNVNHKDMEPQRSGWFECSCCPTNLARLLPSLPGYVYGQKDNAVYVNLFVNSTATISVANKNIEIEQQNNYPWDGDLKFILRPAKSSVFSLLLRLPGWARNEEIPSDLYSFKDESNSKVVVKVNGQAIDYSLQNGYIVINRAWKKNDVVEMNLPMEIRRVVANPLLKENIGKVALQRGPLVYCAEWVDNSGKASNIILPASASFTNEFKPDLLNGVVALKSQVSAVKLAANGEEVNTVKQPFVAIPYYSWANRGKGEMQIWFPERVNYVELDAAKN